MTVLDPEAIFTSLAAHEVEYVLIGGLAAVLHGSPLPTVDADICPARTPGNLARLLHGSRARGTSHDRSDWDFVYLGEETLDPDALLAAINEAIGTDAVDLADLSESSALLRFRAARDGIVVHEVAPGTFDTFRLDAIHTWCDMEPVLTPLYDRVLEDLKR